MSNNWLRKYCSRPPHSLGIDCNTSDRLREYNLFKWHHDMTFWMLCTPIEATLMCTTIRWELTFNIFQKYISEALFLEINTNMHLSSLLKQRNRSQIVLFFLNFLYYYLKAQKLMINYSNGQYGSLHIWIPICINEHYISLESKRKKKIFVKRKHKI